MKESHTIPPNDEVVDLKKRFMYLSVFYIHLRLKSRLYDIDIFCLNAIIFELIRIDMRIFGSYDINNRDVSLINN